MSEHEQLFTQEYNTLLSAPIHPYSYIHGPGPQPNPNTLLAPPPSPPPPPPLRSPPTRSSSRVVATPVGLTSISAICRPRRRPRHRRPPWPRCRRSHTHARKESPRACTKPTLLPRAAPRAAPHAAPGAAPRAAPAPGKYQFAYDVDITRDLEPPDDNLLIRVRPAPCPFPLNGTHARHRSLATHDARRTTHGARRTTHSPRRTGPAARAPPPPPAPHAPLVATLQVSVLKDVGQFVGPESGSNVELKRGDECHHMRTTSWLRHRPAGSLTAPVSARACLRLPRASASLGQ